MTTPAAFLGKEIAIAVVVAALAQAAFVAIFLLPPPPHLEADFSDDQAKPLSVSITPVPLLKLGSKEPTKLPSAWQRAPAAAKAALPDLNKTAPSTKADQTLDPLKPDAGRLALLTDGAVPEPVTSASAAASAGPTDSGAPATASSVLGSEHGSADGTETDPLKARAADIYRAQLASWFAARFAIRGKVPFDKLKTLSATATVSISPDRHVTGFSITRPSGDPVFDEEVSGTLSRIQSGGAELPAPPPAYPEMLTRSIPVSFRCTNQKQCE
jgi:hypothetical protein